MAEINCPICNRLNKDDAERCWYCQAVLHPEKDKANEASDWLDGFRDGNAGGSSEGSGAPSTGENGSQNTVPDWLARIREREQSERGDTPDGNDNGEKDSIDWLRDAVGNDLPGEPAASSTPEENEPMAPEDSGDADWLGKLQSWQSEAPAPEKPTPTQKEELPTGGPFSQEPSPPVPAAPAPGPDWLNEFIPDAPQPEEQQPEKPSEPTSLNEKMGSGKGAPFAEESAAPAEEEPAPESTAPAPVTPDLPFPESNVVKSTSPEPDWLTDFQSLDGDKDLADQVMPKPKAEEPVKPPFSGRDMMNWISKDQAAPESNPEELPGRAEEPQGPDDGIEPAKLPAWLQALRPDKTKHGAPGEKGSGSTDPKSPLAGIEGVLQGDALSQFYTRPQTYANTLKITPEQENHLQRLQNIAGEARWEAQEPIVTKQRGNALLKTIVSVLMIGVIVFAALTHKTPLVEPTLYSQPVVESYNIISKLNPAQPVLIAADFDSSLYGELKWSSQSLLEQLMVKNVPIAFLSTTQAGATLLQSDLAALGEDHLNYSIADQTVNLGYLAGGTVGLQALASDPRTAIALTTSLKPAWTDTPLQDVKKISDFGAVIVITENADTARYWIEQVKPSMGETPLLVVISAQSAPMLQPYYDSGQVNGYIAGESGAAAFEKLAEASGASISHFSAYQITLILLAILIFVGGMISLILRTPSPERSGQE
jgi:hypothetical protein